MLEFPLSRCSTPITIGCPAVRAWKKICSLSNQSSFFVCICANQLPKLWFIMTSKLQAGKLLKNWMT